MQPIQKLSAPRKRLLVAVRGVLTAAMMLSVPVFAVSALGGYLGATEQPAIESGDDAVSNGMRILVNESGPSVRGNSRAAFEDQPSDVVLREWRYTRDTTGSPGM